MRGMADVTTDDLTSIKWLTVNEVAGVLGLDKMTVYRMVSRKEIRASRFGRTFKVQEDHLREFMAAAEDFTMGDAY
jgi:excisionase family DNA binding protein